MNILRDPTDPPSTVVGSSPFNDSPSAEYLDTGLSVGSYYYALQAVSDTDDTGTAQSSTLIAVTGAPGAVSDLAYASGNYTNTIVSFAGSSTAGATYNVYLKQPDDLFLDTTAPAASAGAGSTQVTLPTITGYAGTAQVLIRAVSGGIEEKNFDILTLEYDASGDYVEQRPNTPSISDVQVSSGRTLTATGTYNPDAEAGTATQLALFSRTPSGSYNFSSAEETAALGSEVAGLKRASLTATLANGWHYITAKAVTDSGVQSDGNSAEIAVYLSDADLSAPTGAFTLSRG